MGRKESNQTNTQRMPKNAMKHRYCVTEHIYVKICRLFPLFVKIEFKNLQLPMTSLCNNVILLFEIILQRFMADII